MPAAARLTDQHLCQGHAAPAPIVTAAGTVHIGFRPAARVSDRAKCPATATITAGSATVFIEHEEAARIGDPTSAKGVIVTGFATVNIGSTPEVDALLAAAVSGTPFLDCESCRMAQGR